MDHFAECILTNRQPHTPGEEGLQDHRVMEAIYEAARTGRTVKVPQPPSTTRGPEPAENA
jgi:predicted dehydrogenase